MEKEIITSLNNRMVKEVRELVRKGRTRKERGLFVAEGERLCLEIPEGRLERLFVSEHYHGRLPALEAPAVTVSEEVMASMSDTKTAQGVLAIVREKLYDNFSGDFFLILENIQDPGNLGTMFRTAEAAGVSGILMSGGCVDVFSPKVVRSAMGSVFRVPFRITEDLGEELDRLRTRGVRLFAAHLDGKRRHFEASFRGPSGILIGNEANGLCRETAACADELLRIPMHGKTESLNASQAAAVLLYEVLRQRESSI